MEILSPTFYCILFIIVPTIIADDSDMDDYDSDEKDE